MARNEGMHSDTVVGMAWYRPDQWQQLLQVSADPEDLEDAYEEWQEQAEARMVELQEAGVNIRRVDVDVYDLVRWFGDEGCSIDAAGRSRYRCVSR